MHISQHLSRVLKVLRRGVASVEVRAAGPEDQGQILGVWVLQEDVEREVPTSVALPTALCTLLYKSSLWAWSHGGLWDLGSLWGAG